MVFLFGIMPDEKVIYAFLFTTALFIIFIILLLLRFLKIIKTSYLTILNYSFWTVMTLTVFLIFASFIADFLKKSMCVRKYNLEGNYVIDKEMFNKENALWQYNHYSLNVTEDSLYLIIYNDNKKIKTYSENINYIEAGKHEFISFHGDYDTDKYFSKSEIDSISKHSTKHHMLLLNPILMSNRFSFRLILRSTKYGNMFFIKGKYPVK